MKIIDVKQKSPEWLALRLGKITGSKLNDVVVHRGTGEKTGFYQLIADALAVPEEYPLSAMERGNSFEEQAVDLFTEMTGIPVQKNIGICICDDNENIAVSPDGLILNKNPDRLSYTGAVEVKCLNSAGHIEALMTKEIDTKYRMQVIQEFIVNDDLEVLYFIFYDPRVEVKPLHYLTFTRAELQADIEKYKEYQIELLKRVADSVGAIKAGLL